MLIFIIYHLIRKKERIEDLKKTIETKPMASQKLNAVKKTR